jgi:hypothetical protein
MTGANAVKSPRHRSATLGWTPATPFGRWLTESYTSYLMRRAQCGKSAAVADKANKVRHLGGKGANRTPATKMKSENLLPFFRFPVATSTNGEFCRVQTMFQTASKDYNIWALLEDRVASQAVVRSCPHQSAGLQTADPVGEVVFRARFSRLRFLRSRSPQFAREASTIRQWTYHQNCAASCSAPVLTRGARWSSSKPGPTYFDMPQTKRPSWLICVAGPSHGMMRIIQSSRIIRRPLIVITNASLRTETFEFGRLRFSF